MKKIRVNLSGRIDLVSTLQMQAGDPRKREVAGAVEE